jgi:dihydroorotate dehydrogenase electron transfer subunit
MLDVRATVIAVEEHPLPYYTVRLAVPHDYPEVAPGQFVMVRIGDGLEPYLRRAFSIHDVVRGADVHPGPRATPHERVATRDPRRGAHQGTRDAASGARPERAAIEIHLLGKTIGRGTRALAAAREGDELRVLGPLGRGFGACGAGHAGGRVALVAGGVGSAALLLLARRLADEGPFDVLYGGRSAIDLPAADEFGRLAASSGGELVVTTEDGTAGRRGLVTEPLVARLAARAYRHLYACGPMGLLARLAALCEEHGVPGEAALETAMGCGFGACLGCAVPHVAGHYALCCKDGPVFRFDEVAW